jgi:alkaline phosphatase D
MHRLICVLIVQLCCVSCAPSFRATTLPRHALGPKGPEGFIHGVASGDPQHDRVILWTRYTPRDTRRSVTVSWVISRAPDLSAPEASGRLTTTEARDFTVKVDATGLKAGTRYYYRFWTESFLSPLGRTQTLPTGHVERLRIAFVSCSNVAWGYFHAYAELAERDDLDFVLHLGDYIYEHADGVYGNGSEIGRTPVPNKELISLRDYRLRYAQYRADHASQAVHAAYPLIATWDDHEFANNAWVGGAQNHSPASEGDWAARRRSAVQAYYEWLPIRSNGNLERPRIYRAFQVGDLARLLVLDTRIAGRDRQVGRDDPALRAPWRTILGIAQEAWLRTELREAAASSRWQLIGQQVLFSRLSRADGTPLLTDSWGGYPAVRRRLLELVAREQLQGLIVLTGDFHRSVAIEVPDETRAKQDQAASLAVEFVAPGISSPGHLDPEKAQEDERWLRGHNPHVKWIEQLQQGYGILELTHERARAQWHLFSDVRSPDRPPMTRPAKVFEVRHGEHLLREVTAQKPADGGP